MDASRTKHVFQQIPSPALRPFVERFLVVEFPLHYPVVLLQSRKGGGDRFIECLRGDLYRVHARGIGRLGGIRTARAIVPANKPDDEGHVFVIDETESVWDPSPNTPIPFDMPKLFGRLVGQKVECVVRIEKV
jgi:hypothetical protein